MTSSCCATGALSKLALNGNRYEFIQFVPTKIVQIASDGSTQAIRGTLDRNIIDVTYGLQFVEFYVDFWLHPTQLDTLLPLADMPESPTDTFVLGDALPTFFDIVLGMNNVKEQKFGNAVVSGWRIHGAKGDQPVKFTMRFVAESWTEQTAGTTFVSSSNPAMIDGPLMSFTNGTMTLQGSTRAFNQVSYDVDYALQKEFNNSQTLTNICPTSHDITIGTSVLYTTCDGNNDLITTPLGAVDQAASSFVLNFQRTVSAGNYQTQVTTPAVWLMPRPPAVQKRSFNRLPVQGIGLASGGTPACTILNKVNES